jgi:membrane protein DedA with SNARE-associated domain
MGQNGLKILVIGILVLILIYALLRRRTEKIRKDRNVRSRFRRER